MDDPHFPAFIPRENFGTRSLITLPQGPSLESHPRSTFASGSKTHIVRYHLYIAPRPVLDSRQRGIEFETISKNALPLVQAGQGGVVVLEVCPPEDYMPFGSRSWNDICRFGPYHPSALLPVLIGSACGALTALVLGHKRLAGHVAVPPALLIRFHKHSLSPGRIHLVVLYADQRPSSEASGIDHQVHGTGLGEVVRLVETGEPGADKGDALVAQLLT